MAPRTRSHRRLFLPLALAVMLAGGAVGLVTAARIAGAGVAPTPVGAPSLAPGAPSIARDRAVHQRESSANARATVHGSHRSLPRAVTVRPDVAPAAQSATVVAPVRSAAPAYRGRNHVWIPALRIDQSVGAFPCSRTRPPDNHVYRWGCAGRNNVYLMGHAYSVFKPLHDAYVSGRLRKGMKVFYADSAGHVRTYSVIWWKVTRPTPGAAWAWAPQSRPSMTLQTCVGARSEYRLMVRLVATD